MGVGSVTLTESGTTITYALEQLTCDDRVYVVLAANGCMGGSHSGGEGNFRGQLHAKDGGKIDWSCTTQDGQSGKVIIDGQEFDFTRGALFLVSTKDKPTRVEQVVIDAGQLQVCSDAKKFPRLANADPRIATCSWPGRIGAAGWRTNNVTLCCLHSTGWSTDDGTIIGEYTVTWDDDTTVTIPIRYGKDLLDWWFDDSSPEPSEAKVSWKGENTNAQAAGKKVRLYLTTWENPKPDLKVKSIDLSSTNETACEPMCLAITAQ